MKNCSRLLVFVLAAIIATSLAWQGACAQDREALSPDDQEIAAHLVGKLPVIRMDLSKFPELESIGGVPVELLVDAQGNVTSAKVEDEDEVETAQDLTGPQRETLKAVIAEVHKTAPTLRFRPFEQAGRPIAAQFEIYIPIQPLEERAASHSLFPSIHHWKSLKIILSRTGCYGSCPSYTVEVHGDGTVIYDGSRYVAITGSHRGSISSDAVSQLVDAFRAADYFSLRDRYMWGATDLPTYTTSISIDGKTKQVVDYAGEHAGMPPSVSKLEETIDRLSGVERWTKGNSETVPALTQEKFDFKSPQASEILANVAQRGNADAVRDLVAAGVTMSSEPPKNRFGMHGTALENAAWRGDVEMLRALLNGGIKDPDIKTQALSSAASAGKIDAVRFLNSSGANPIAPQVLVSASASGIPSVVQEILKYKPDVNSRDQDGQTALLACLHAYHGKDENVNLKAVIRILLDAGADPNIADNKGMTPLIANAWDFEIAQMLIAHGADVNARAQDSFTPLLNAGTAEVTRVLLEHGADPFAKTKDGETALDFAKGDKRKDQAKLLEAAMAGKKQ